MEFLRQWWWAVVVAIEAGTRVVLIGRVILQRTPVPYTLAWILFLLFVPVLSPLIYLLIGEPTLGRTRKKRFASVRATLERELAEHFRPVLTEAPDARGAFGSMVRLGTKITGLPAMRGNALDLISEGRDFHAKLTDDIDRAQKHCNLFYYIWEPDETGERLAQAVMRAARRGVACRVMVDGAGSRRLLRSTLWKEMAAAGVLTAEALPVSPVRALFERVDMRNHRKIAVIDGCVAYCGSHNVTNENFTTRKASNLAPYLDATVRLRGPAVHALQCVFFRDWVLDSSTTQLPDVRTMLSDIQHAGQSTVQVVPSGPAPYDESLQHALLAMMFGARQRLSVTTPYFVPDEATKSALANAALRGVDVTLIVPMWSDSRLVTAAGRSHFDELLEAGVRIHRHRYGLLHAKSAVADDALSVIGSANFDMRSFSLNFEVTLIVADPDFASRLLALHASYLERSEPVGAASWRQRPLAERFIDNLAQLAGPLL